MYFIDGTPPPPVGKVLVLGYSRSIYVRLWVGAQSGSGALQSRSWKNGHADCYVGYEALPNSSALYYCLDSNLQTWLNFGTPAALPTRKTTVYSGKSRENAQAIWPESPRKGRRFSKYCRWYFERSWNVSLIKANISGRRRRPRRPSHGSKKEVGSRFNLNTHANL